MNFQKNQNKKQTLFYVTFAVLDDSYHYKKKRQ